MISEAELASLDIDLFVWTPIMKGFATLKEMREDYCLEDVYDFHTVIALQNKIDERAQKRSE